MKKVLIILLFSFSLIRTFAQNEEIDLAQFAERLFQVQDEDILYEDIYESLLLFYTNKLNINRVTPEELASLYLLNPNQINQFFIHRDRFGDFLSINELQAVPDFSVETIRSLKPFITVEESFRGPRPLIQRMLNEENNYLLLRYTRRLEEQLGYTSVFPLDTTFIRDEMKNITDTVLVPPNRYRGSQNKLYGRFRVSHREDFSLGFTFEKDAGEQISFRNNQGGFDFYSYHLLLQNKWGLGKVILGDYQLQVGQGLVFGAGFSAGKGAETVNAIKRNNLGLKPYTSALESGHFRGAGISKTFKKIAVTIFYSNLKQDGNVIGDTTYSNFDEFVNSIQQTGLHRTDQELSTRNQIEEQSLGGVLEYKHSRKFTLGASVLHTSYSRPIQKRPNNYNQFEFQGDDNLTSSGYFSFNWQNFYFFGETARSSSGGLGAIGGFVASLSPIMDIGFSLRNYDRDFHSFYGNALTEGSRIINEKGTYWGLSITPTRKHQVNVYYDKFSFPWLRFQSEAPSNGYEYLGRYTYRPRRGIILYAQIRQQSRQVSIPEGNLNILKEQLRKNYVFNIDYAPGSFMKLKTRIQGSTQTEAGNFSKGFAILQDIGATIWKLKVQTRVALFDTDDFDNRQYVYENDVLYAFSIPGYSGTGVRNYVIVRYDPTRSISLWARYARTTFRNPLSNPVVGSGLDRSNGNINSEVKLMMRLKLGPH